MQTSLFTCAICGGHVRLDGEEAICQGCEISFPRIESAIDLLRDETVEGEERSLETDFVPHRKPRGPISTHLGRRTMESIHEILTDFSGELGRKVDVLDVGCGTKADPRRGYSYLDFLEEIARSYRGIDPSPHCVAMSSRSGSRLERFEIGEVARAAGEAIPLGDDTVDVVIMVSSLDHAADPAKVVAECHRVLRPGGLLTIQSATHHGWLMQFLRRLSPGRMAARGQRDHHVHLAIGDLSKLVNAAGFIDCRVEESGYLALPPQGRRLETLVAALGSLAGRRRFLGLMERLDDSLADRRPGYGSRVVVTARSRG